MIDREKLTAYSEDYRVVLTPEQLDQFDSYCRLLLEWNKKMNLTAIREPEEVLIKHFVDSLALLKFAELREGDAGHRRGHRSRISRTPLKNCPAGSEADLIRQPKQAISVFAGGLPGTLGIEANLSTAAPRKVENFPACGSALTSRSPGRSRR